MHGIVVVGGGQAGASLVAKLRARGFDGPLTLVSAEPVAPYQRPPLSKAYLLGEMAAERLALKSPDFYTDQDITLRLGAEVTGIDPAARQIQLGAETLAYDQLALTTGSVPRRLPDVIGGGLGNLFGIRTLDDIDRLRPLARPGARALVIGGGYIGLEAAAVATKLGLEVTVIEMAERILQRVACPETSDYFRALHRRHGVEIREGTGLTRLTGTDRVTGAILSDGSEISTDLAIAGIGIAPATALGHAAGLEIDNGIATDAFGRTSDPAIWAAGDCASFPRHGARIRLESVQNAIDQAETVAANMLGANLPYDPKPWFWSDQFDVKLQIAGLNTGYNSVVTRPGDRPGAQSHWYYAGETLLAVDAMNDARNYMIGKRLIENRKSPAPGLIADPGSDLKALLK